VTDELARVLQSEPFQRSPRLRKFLGLIVEHAVLGKAEYFKELMIAVMVFDRHASSFDAQRDPIVRVEAGRLREKLERYYAGEGADARLRITIPKGRYRPVFHETAGPRAGLSRGYTPSEPSFDDLSPDVVSADAVGSRSTARTRNAQAQDCYERGRYAAQQRDSTAYSKAIQLFRRAIEVDGSFAEAHAALATTLLNFAAFALLPSGELASEARSAARQAILLDPNSAEAYVALAVLEHRIDRDWPAAEQSYARALALAPTSPNCHSALGLALATRGRLREAASHVLRARELDPLNIDLRITLAQVLYFGRRYAEAVGILTALLEIAPRHALAEIALGFAELYWNKPREAREAFVRASALLPGHPSPQLCVAAALAGEGHLHEARAHLTEVLEWFTGQYYSRYHLAIVYAYLGDHESVYSALAETAEKNDFLLANLPVEPAFDAYHGDARFRAALSGYGLAALETCELSS
jgi:tetratricopeptide (TPR) repeat protein